MELHLSGLPSRVAARSTVCWQVHLQSLCSTAWGPGLGAPPVGDACRGMCSREPLQSAGTVSALHLSLGVHLPERPSFHPSVLLRVSGLPESRTCSLSVMFPDVAWNESLVLLTVVESVSWRNWTDIEDRLLPFKKSTVKVRLYRCCVLIFAFLVSMIQSFGENDGPAPSVCSVSCPPPCPLSRAVCSFLCWFSPFFHP